MGASSTRSTSATRSAGRSWTRSCSVRSSRRCGPVSRPIPASKARRDGAVVRPCNGEARARGRVPGWASLVALFACGASGTTTSAISPTPTRSTHVQVLHRVRTGAGPIGIASAFGSVWVVNSEFRVHDRGSVTRIDPTTGRVLATITVGSVPLETTSAAGSIWVSNSGDGTVSRIDPSIDRVVATIDVCAAPEGLAPTGATVWGVCEDDDAVGRIDTSRERMVSTTDVGITPRFALAAFDAVWVSNYVGSTISRIDPATGKVVSTIETASGPQLMLASGGRLWVSATDEPAVRSID